MINPQTAVEVLREFVREAKSWHQFHHGSDIVACDSICELIPKGEAAIAADKASAALELDRSRTAIACLDCGCDYTKQPLDVTLSGEQWKMIHPDIGGVLCASCMVNRASKLPGVITFAARIAFGSDYDKFDGPLNPETFVTAAPQQAAGERSWRKRPVVIEAVRWDGDNWQELYDFCRSPEGSVMITGPHPQVYFGKVGPRESVTIETSEGVMAGRHGDWIIKGVKGEFYPCKPDIFQATYEPATLPPNVERSCCERMREACAKHIPRVGSLGYIIGCTECGWNPRADIQKNEFVQWSEHIGQLALPPSGDRSAAEQVRKSCVETFQRVFMESNGPVSMKVAKAIVAMEDLSLPVGTRGEEGK